MDPTGGPCREFELNGSSYSCMIATGPEQSSLSAAADTRGHEADTAKVPAISNRLDDVAAQTFLFIISRSMVLDHH